MGRVKTQTAALWLFAWLFLLTVSGCKPDPKCQGNPDDMPCTCMNPATQGCYPPLNDDPVVMGAARTDGGTAK